MDHTVHPELDDSPLCASEDITRFQHLLGALQWTMSLCCFDIAGPILCLNSYNLCPRENYLKWMKQIAACVCHTKDHGTRFRNLIPDYSHHEIDSFNWARSVHTDASEQLPINAPTPLGKFVRTTNPMHNLVNGRSCTGIIHFLNQTPIDWHAKRQAQVETATHGSEFVAARIAVEQIIDLCAVYACWEHRLTARHGCLGTTKALSKAAPFLILDWRNGGAHCPITACEKQSLQASSTSCTSREPKTQLIA